MGARERLNLSKATIPVCGMEFAEWLCAEIDRIDAKIDDVITIASRVEKKTAATLTDLQEQLNSANKVDVRQEDRIRNLERTDPVWLKLEPPSPPIGRDGSPAKLAELEAALASHNNTIRDVRAENERLRGLVKQLEKVNFGEAALSNATIHGCEGGYENNPNRPTIMLSGNCWDDSLASIRSMVKDGKARFTVRIVPRDPPDPVKS